MLDFTAWTRRLSVFLRQLTGLPGTIKIQDAIEPPARDQSRRDWLESDQCDIPQVVRRFLLTASRRCCFSYCWSPPVGRPIPESIRGLNCAEFRGGGDLCEAAKYQVYANRDRIRARRGPVLSSFGGKSVGGLPHMVDTMEEERSRGRLPILAFEDAEGLISLDGQVANDVSAVFYVGKAGDPEADVLSPSFEQFLLAWEMTCYTYPTIENLMPWLDPVTRQLRPDPEKSKTLCQLLCGYADPIMGDDHV